ncbi:MAG: GHMP kinase, partial [Fidelibacterota bacterium]
DTIGILSQCRDSRLALIQKLDDKNPNSSFHTLDEMADLSDLNGDEIEIYNGTIKNRDLLKKGLMELEKNNINHKLIGRLLSDQHQVLRDVLQVSSSKIEVMMDAALSAGALGGKINGSGGGGCMFVYAPENPEKVAEAIEEIGGKVYIVEASEGTKVD